MVQDKFKEQLTTTKGEVQTLMIKYESTRENDLLLACVYLKEYMGIQIPELTKAQLNRGGVLGTILRVRREIQNDDNILLPNSPDVRRQRRIKEEDYRSWYGRKNRE